MLSVSYVVNLFFWKLDEMTMKPRTLYDKFLVKEHNLDDPPF